MKIENNKSFFSSGYQSIHNSKNKNTFITSPLFESPILRYGRHKLGFGENVKDDGTHDSDT